MPRTVLLINALSHALCPRSWLQVLEYVSSRLYYTDNQTRRILNQEEDDSDPSDGEWSQPTYSNASRSPSPTLKSFLPLSYYPSRKCKASAPPNDEKKKEPRKGTKRSKPVPLLTPKVASTPGLLVRLFFSPKEAIRWTSEQFEAYWPLINNFLIRNKPDKPLTA